MTSINFAEGNENSVLGFLACAVLCVGALAISLELGMIMAALIATGILLLGCKNLVVGIATRP